MQAPPQNAIAGTGSRDVWTAGRGDVLHDEGASWQHVFALAPVDVGVAGDGAFRAVWASSSNDVWIGGEGGRLVHFDGARWRQVDGAPGTITALWGVARVALRAGGPRWIGRVTRFR